MSAWGSTVERERQRRIFASVWAYAYEIANDPVVSDHIFDRCVQHITPKLTTGHPVLDEFFLTQFSPMTGMWIHQHPELPKIKALYDRYNRIVRERG